jgi:hypothetical protein
MSDDIPCNTTVTMPSTIELENQVCDKLKDGMQRADCYVQTGSGTVTITEKVGIESEMSDSAYILFWLCLILAVFLFMAYRERDK